MRTVSVEDIYPILKERKKDAEKGDHGRLMIVGGSYRCINAPVLTGIAAYRAGVDAATICTPRRVAPIIQTLSLDVRIRELMSDSFITPRDVPLLIEEVNKHNSVIIGPGGGGSADTKKAYRRFIGNVKKSIAIDASGISSLKKNINKINGRKIVLTPNIKEFRKLTGKKIESFEEACDEVKKFCKEHRTVVVLKGEKDIISDGNKLFVNETGNPGMSCAGTGDVFVGVLGAFMARKIGRFDAATATAFIVGRAADDLYERYGYGYTASDLALEIAFTIKNIPTK
ncbi:MAG: NAD(P)H-hydrate dehydratase [Candidatus Altiarchaeales archaeon WOR_SM1_86-2]|nr:MAG: NAD(P)H-hydrate dehydratase [Candidatus Altiarchaeales archaeon WOR_SM1_86-2]ODS41722.1 MAG: NAD(P)H-hydrate dehydratase [Candidatus Altiarchaeales archaeon WOR_SM1_79]